MTVMADWSLTKIKPFPCAFSQKSPNFVPDFKQQTWQEQKEAIWNGHDVTSVSSSSSLS